MSRSFRHFHGLNHTFSDTKMGKQMKHHSHSQIRAQLKENFEEAKPIGKMCSKFRGYDHLSYEKAAKKELKNRSEGYDPWRIVHQWKGK